MEFIDTTLAHKLFFTVEHDVFEKKEKGKWMIRARLRPVQGIKTRNEARELAEFLNHKIRVALTQWEDDYK